VEVHGRLSAPDHRQTAVVPSTVGAPPPEHDTAHGDGKSQPFTTQPVAGQPTLHLPPAQSTSQLVASWQRTLHVTAPSHATSHLSAPVQSKRHDVAPWQRPEQSPEDLQSTRQSSSWMQLA
jgi:hypothetical protein